MLIPASTCRTGSYDPHSMRRLMRSLHAGLPAMSGSCTRDRSVPRMTSWEADDGYGVEMEVPGFSKESLEIAVHDQVLEITGTRSEETHEENAQWLRRERTLGSFTRKLRIPQDVDVEKVEARTEAGLLTITLPKKENALPRQIEVEG